MHTRGYARSNRGLKVTKDEYVGAQGLSICIQILVIKNIKVEINEFSFWKKVCPKFHYNFLFLKKTKMWTWFSFTIFILFYCFPFLSAVLVLRGKSLITNMKDKSNNVKSYIHWKHWQPLINIFLKKNNLHHSFRHVIDNIGKKDIYLTRG